MFFFAAVLISTRVEVFFSATDGCRERILRSINGAVESIYVAIYTFTSREIAEALVEAARRGVDVKVIMDPSQAEEKFSKYNFLRKNGIRVVTPVYDVPQGRGRFFRPKMHHKFIVFDKKYVLTGSYNLTASAEELNDENCVFIYEDKRIVQRFIDEFNRLWRISR